MLVLPGLEPAEPPFTPDSSIANQFDERAAEFFYKRCQQLGIQLIMVPNEVTEMRYLCAGKKSRHFSPATVLGCSRNSDFELVL